MSEIDASLSRAISFLRRRRREDGLWYEFRTLAGTSSEWVSAFIVWILSECEDCDWVQTTVDSLLGRQRSDGGWGYGPAVPPDCDSTAWAILALSAGQSLRHSALLRGARFVSAHQGPNGGFCTYRADSGIADFTGLRKPDALTGWLSEQVCVSGVAIQALLEARALACEHTLADGLAYLERARDTTSGTWSSYWWTGTAYASYHSLKSLSNGHSLAPEMLGSACRRLRYQQQADGAWSGNGDTSEPFETAFATLTLLLEPNAHNLAAARHGLHWLLAQQQNDGSWVSCPMLRIPPPRVSDAASVEFRSDRQGARALLADRGRAFTTAAAVRALAVSRRMIDA